MGSTFLSTKGLGTHERLTDKERAFVHEYLVDFHGKRAAIAAGYSPHRADAQAVTLLKKPKIQRAIGHAQKKAMERVELKHDEVLFHLKTALFLDPKELFHNVGDAYRLKNLDEIPESVRGCITKLKCKVRTLPGSANEQPTTETYFEIDLMSKESALLLAMKYLGLLVEKKEVANTVNLNWDDLARGRRAEEPDIIEGRIAQAALPAKRANTCDNTDA